MTWAIVILVAWLLVTVAVFCGAWSTIDTFGYGVSVALLCLLWPLMVSVLLLMAIKDRVVRAIRKAGAK